MDALCDRYIERTRIHLDTERRQALQAEPFYALETMIEMLSLSLAHLRSDVADGRWGEAEVTIISDGLAYDLALLNDEIQRREKLRARGFNWAAAESRIPSDLPRQLKQDVDLAEFVVHRGWVKLRRVGAHYIGACPFHDDRSPSFSVSDDGLWFCFACGEGGDVYSFVMRAAGVSFRDAFNIVAGYVGVRIPTRARTRATQQAPGRNVCLPTPERPVGIPVDAIVRQRSQ
jgi:hypothetical protein